MSRLVFEPPLGVWSVVLAAAAGGVTLCWLLWRERRAGRASVGWWASMGFRGLAWGLVVWALAGPQRMTEPAEARWDMPRPRPVVVLADTSQSMQQRDATGGRSRWELLREHWLTRQNPVCSWSLGPPRVLWFDEEVREAGWVSEGELERVEPDGVVTHLFEALDGLASRPPAFGGEGLVLVLSDGGDTAGGDAAATGRKLAEAGWRVAAVPVGGGGGAPDRSVVAWADAETLMRGQQTTLYAEVHRVGGPAVPVPVELWHRSERIDTQVAHFRDQAAGNPGQATARVRFQVRPEPTGGPAVSQVRYELRLPEATGELNTQNNRADVSLQVTRERARVLLLEGEPHWETKFLARLLREDPQVALTAVFALGERRMVQREPGAAGGERPWSELSRFDLVVLGRRAERFFADADDRQELVRFVQQQGGSLVLARGPAFALPVAPEVDRLAPVAWGERITGPLRWRLTDPGRATVTQAPAAADAPVDSVVQLTELPTLRAATRIQGLQAASVVLFEQTAATEPADAPMAAMVHHRSGHGRVLALLSHGLWRWSFQPPHPPAAPADTNLSPADTARGYRTLWQRLVRWLVLGNAFLPGERVWLSLSRSHSHGTPGERVSVQLAARAAPADYRPVVQIIGPGDQTRRLPLTRHSPDAPRFAARFTPEASGIYRVVLPADTLTNEPLRTEFTVGHRVTDADRPQARPDLLHSLARSTGGVVLPLDDPQALTKWLTANEEARKRPATREPLIDQPWLAAVVVALLAVAWYLRRRGGLI